MKIVLHSDQSLELTADHDRSALRGLTGKREPRIGYIPSAPDPRRRYFREREAYYQRLGFSSLEYFDPEEEHSPAEVDAFFRLDAIHLSGGQVTSFRERLRFTGCDERLVAFARRGGVLIGVSAGAMLMGESFSCVSFFGEKGETDGLGLFDFEVFPHVNEKFPNLELLKAHVRRSGRSLYAMNDGDMVILNGGRTVLKGSPTLLTHQESPDSKPRR